MNQFVKVKLTPLGAEIYYHQCDEAIKLGVPLERKLPQVDKNGFTEMQLWEYIELFGPHTGMCKPNVTTDLCMYIEDKYLEEVTIK